MITTIKEFRLGTRDLVNKLTGQYKQIVEYNVITSQLARAGDREKDETKKRK